MPATKQLRNGDGRKHNAGKRRRYRAATTTHDDDNTRHGNKRRRQQMTAATNGEADDNKNSNIRQHSSRKQNSSSDCEGWARNLLDKTTKPQSPLRSLPVTPSGLTHISTRTQTAFTSMQENSSGSIRPTIGIFSQQLPQFTPFTSSHRLCTFMTETLHRGRVML